MNFNYQLTQKINMEDDQVTIISKLMTENRDLLREIDKLNIELKKKTKNDILFKDNAKLQKENKDLKKHINKLEIYYQKLDEKTQNYDIELKNNYDTIDTLNKEIAKLKLSKEEILEKCQYMIEYERRKCY